MHLVQGIIQHDLKEEKDMSADPKEVADETAPSPQDKEEEVIGDSPTVDNTPNSSTEDEEEESLEEEADDEVDEEEEEEDEEEEEEEEDEEEEDDDDEEEEEEVDLEAEARAIAEATASADKSYVPPTSLLNSPSPYPLIRSVDGMSLKKYNPAPSVFTARSVPVPLRGKLNVPIHVTIGGSVVEYTVESQDYDIGFGVVAEREEGVTVVTVSIENRNCFIVPFQPSLSHLFLSCFMPLMFLTFSCIIYTHENTLNCSPLIELILI